MRECGGSVDSKIVLEFEIDAMNFSGDRGIGSAPIEAFACIAMLQLAANCRIVRIRLIRIQPMRIKVPSAIKTQFKITVAGFDPGAVFIAEINRLTIGNADMGQFHQA